jgi:hypothetical protein
MVEALSRQLFSDEDAHAFAILDGASVPDLLTSLHDEHQPEFCCLYRGELKPDIAEVAPYLVRLEPDAKFTHWLIEQGWGNHWGIFAVAPVDLRAMRQHFRRFLIVHDPDGKPLYFRYYDPRVLRVYLPTCNAEELKVIFGPVHHFVLEAGDPGIALQFQMDNGALRQEKVPLKTS